MPKEAPSYAPMSPNVEILLQPVKCALTGQAFTDGNGTVVLRCGCVLCMVEADNCTTASGFVFCPVCEFTYNVDDKMDLLTTNKQLQPLHINAQKKRCAFYKNEINDLLNQLDLMILDSEPELEEKEDALTWLNESDSSSASDSSEADTPNYLDFDATPHSMYQRRLAKLKERRDRLVERKKTLAAAGAAAEKPWATDPDWRPAQESDDAIRIAARVERRNARRAKRTERAKEKAAHRGAYKVVHNSHVLDKNVPKKWVQDNPNKEKPANWEEKEREKKGWLTEAEMEEMDEEEQEVQKTKRRAAWKATQSKIPTLPGSVQRQRWAQRLYRQFRRDYYLTEKIAGLKAVGNTKQADKWQARKDIFSAKAEATKAKCAARVQKLTDRKDFERVKRVQGLFDDAVKIGQDEVEAEVAAKKAAEEAAKAKAEAEAAAKAKAEEKAKAKAEAEARGETWVDPDAAEGNEGDEGDE